MVDQYFTTNEMAKQCVRELYDVIGGDPTRFQFIEPSAGAGAFLRHLPYDKTTALDIEPLADNIQKADFLTWVHDYHEQQTLWKSKPKPHETIIIGNPPFGRGGATARDFINYGDNIANTIAFVLPIIFTRYAMHRELHPALRLVHERIHIGCKWDLPNGRQEEGINAVFQIWTRNESLPNLRIKKQEPDTHEDFLMWEVSRDKTPIIHEGIKFDFAVPCSGFTKIGVRDYHTKATSMEEIGDGGWGWILIKALSKDAEERLRKIDYHAIAHERTTVPGFSRYQVVKAYKELLEAGE